MISVELGTVAGNLQQSSGQEITSAQAPQWEAMLNFTNKYLLETFFGPRNREVQCHHLKLSA